MSRASRGLPTALLSIALLSTATNLAYAQADGGVPPEVEEARRAGVLARVGEVTITLGEVEDAINAQSPLLRVRYRDRNELERFVETMVRFELLARAAAREELGDDPAIRREVRQRSVQQLVRRDFDESEGAVNVTDEEVRTYYDTHPEEFTQPELRRAQHIAVATRDEAVTMLARVREATPADLRQIVRDQSQDPETRLRAGDLRYFDEDGIPRNARDPQVAEELATAAFAIEEDGEWAPEPIQVRERWSILRLTAIRPAEHLSFTQAEGGIRGRLWRDRRQHTLEDFVRGLREHAGVEANYELLRPIRFSPPEREEVDPEETSAAVPVEGELPIAPRRPPEPAPP